MSVVGNMRTALVAALVLALLGMSVASAHVLPCADATGAADHVRSGDDANAHAAVHTKTNDIDKQGGAHPDRCCALMCNLCNAFLPTGSVEQPLATLVKHRLDRGDRVAGIFVGQPHGPPRS